MTHPKGRNGGWFFTFCYRNTAASSGLFTFYCCTCGLRRCIRYYHFFIHTFTINPHFLSRINQICLG